MQRNVLEYLENIVVKFPEKVAYADGTCQLTFKEVYSYSRAIGTFLIQQCHTKEPIVVFMSRRPETIVAYYGVVYSGCCYVPIDEEMPRIRIELIFKSLNPSAVICDENTRQALKSYEYTGKVYLYEDIIKTKEDTRSLMQIRNKQLDIDPLYIVYIRFYRYA